MSDSSFPPETIDEQTGQGANTLSHEDAHLVDDLHRIYQPLADENARSLERVQTRLAQRQARFASSSLYQPPTKRRYMKTRLHIFSQGSAAAAVLLLVVLVGSMAALFTQVGHGKNTTRPIEQHNTPTTSATTTTTAGPPSPAGIYIVSYAQISKLDLQTRKQLWSRQVGERATSYITVSSDTVYLSAGDDNYTTANNYVYALDVNTGAVRWKVLVSHDVSRGEDGSGPYNLGLLTTPTVGNGMVFVGARDGKFFALDAATGKQRWVYKAPASALVSDPVTINGSTAYNYTIYNFDRVAVDQGVMYGSVHNVLFAVDVQTGKQLWLQKIDSKQILNGPVVVNGVIYLSSFEESNHSNPFIESGYAYAYAAQDGKQLWQFKAGGWVHTSPTVVDGVVYFGSFDLNLYAVKASTGALLWRFNTHGVIYSQPVVANGIVFINEEGPPVPGALALDNTQPNLFAVKASSGKLVWQKSLDVNLLIAAQDSTLYVSDSSGRLCGYNVNDGSLLWQVALDTIYLIVTIVN